MASKNWLKELEVIHKLEARYGSMDSAIEENKYYITEDENA
ncbi:hypothetical protein [Lactiplantibacillus plantarum]|nr:hypothetical protein [Lactiplantibacillus plantarum]